MRLPFLCRLVGHKPAKRFSGLHRRSRAYIAVMACPRCGKVLAGATGARRDRREAWRRQWGRG